MGWGPSDLVKYLYQVSVLTVSCTCQMISRKDFQVLKIIKRTKKKKLGTHGQTDITITLAIAYFSSKCAKNVERSKFLRTIKLLRTTASI